jgi:threonine 3-dehydrogenase
MTMKALMKKQPGKGLSMERVSIPTCDNSSVLIKIMKAAICGTDVHIYNWDEWAQRTINTPMIIGHEFVGEVVDKGAEVKGFEIGDRVSGEGHIVCGICRSCLAGRRHLCTQTVSVGVNRDGCFAEYLSLPVSNAWHVDPSIPSETAAIFDPFGNATHATLSFELVGEDVLITGAGPIGIMSAAIARHVGARYIVITDVNDYRLEIARTMGATRTVNVTRTSIEECKKQLGMIGFDIGLEMSGHESAFESMLENMYHGGRISLLGIQPGMSQIDCNNIVFKGLTIKGIYGREIFETWYKMQTMLKSGLDITPVITHRFPFDEYQKGFDAMLSGRSGKVILEFD